MPDSVSVGAGKKQCGWYSAAMEHRQGDCIAFCKLCTTHTLQKFRGQHLIDGSSTRQERERQRERERERERDAPAAVPKRCNNATIEKGRSIRVNKNSTIQYCEHFTQFATGCRCSDLSHCMQGTRGRTARFSNWRICCCSGCARRFRPPQQQGLRSAAPAFGSPLPCSSFLSSLRPNLV